EVLDYIDQLEAEGKAFVIRPQSPIKVGRTGSDTKKLEELYEEGYECGKQITQL
ncbi:MAG TPA: patatin family protein, partial [Parabacteroides distasonis]|nr:patatin family protein [Parabacteroides distasonis]